MAQESVSSIAMKQTGAPIQVATVRNHLLTAWSFGQPLELKRLVEESELELPCEEEWLQMEEAAAGIGADFEREVKLKELLQGILGCTVCREVAEKSLEERETERRWYERLRIFEAFRKVRFEPSFRGEAKRQRLA